MQNLRARSLHKRNAFGYCRDFFMKYFQLSALILNDGDSGHICYRFFIVWYKPFLLEQVRSWELKKYVVSFVSGRGGDSLVEAKESPL